MNRAGHVYEQMADWDNIVEAERISTRRKLRNPGVARHLQHRIKDLVEIQHIILQGKMKTSKYHHDKVVSGQDKLRDIAKLHFHPNHIEHQLLTMAAEERIDRNLIRHTYASRKGYGQIACAMQIRRNIAKYRHTERWFAQGDICKYYQSINHKLLRDTLTRLFKDKRFVDAFMEPFERYAPEIGIPLGIRPSQSAGNVTLSPFDHFMLEENKCEDYVRYLDDFFFTGATKGEVKRKMKRTEKYLNDRGFKLHVPKIHRIHEGVDMMGFVCYGYRSDGWWRKSDKKRWLRNRSHVTNPRRLRELDDAALGMLKWGNRDCKRLWMKVTKRRIKKDRHMSVRFSATGIKTEERKDKNGVPFIEARKIGMQMLLGKTVEVDRCVTGLTTSHGADRYALHVHFMGEWYKLIVNSVDIKMFFDSMQKNHVTLIKTVFIDTGGMHYKVDESRTEILEVNHRKVEERDGKVVYSDTGEKVMFNN